MKNMTPYSGLVLLLCAHHSMAGTPVSLPVAPLSAAPLPLDISGIAAIAGVTLILGIQLIKRKK
jgi:hypothetical protein